MRQQQWVGHQLLQHHYLPQKKFSFSTPEQEEHQQRIVEKNRFENGPQTKGNWKPAPWRQRPQSTTALSGHMTRPKKKDGKRRLSAPIARKGEGSMSEMTSDNSRPGTDGGGGRINVNMCSVPEEDVSLKAPPNSSSRGSGNGGLSKAAVAALGGTPGNTNNSTSKTSAARRFLRPRTGGERVTTTESRDGKSNYGGEEDQASVSSIGGSSIGGSSIGGASIASAPARMRAGSFHAVEAHKARLDEEIDQLLVDIRRVGTNPGEPSVAFGELFDDDEVQNYYEALVGTLKSAKRRGVVHFKGQMLLKGMHDNVMIDIVNP
uniref:Costars domain-containing protein n=1 Tax=Helicotheca tamesis TaxID=374047 RepID=A0A7S2IC92_9STRA|mmetsp:Transcript_7836/g.10726  ORF Transcript_7836/g.10726 Transcript_7836/m.10726 type:complete len:320 (+) Transcript_7836:1055-2014(+)